MAKRRIRHVDKKFYTHANASPPWSDSAPGLKSLADDFEKRFQDFKTINALIKFGNNPVNVRPIDAEQLAELTGFDKFSFKTKFYPITVNLI